MFLTWEDAAWVSASPRHTVKSYSRPPVARRYQVRGLVGMEHRTGERNSPAGTGEHHGARSPGGTRNRRHLVLTLAVLRPTGFASYGTRCLPRSRPSVNSNLSRRKRSGCRCRARRRAKIERPNRGSLSRNQATCARNSFKIRTARQLYGCGNTQPEERWKRLHGE